jgi:hypothetical protein
MIKNFTFTFSLIFIQLCLNAQLPEYGQAFLQNEVASIYITIDADSIDAVLSQENWGNDREFPASFRYESSFQNDTVEEIGFRLRGNTSLQAGKKSFKVSFNTYNQGQKWEGLEKLNLNGSHNDPSMIRVALCWNAIRRAGLPGCRTSFIKLYINDEYKGLYTNVEHVDEEFTDTYFAGSQYTSLFKCLYPAPLDYISDNPDDYNFFEFGRRPYDQKTNDYTQDYSELANFIEIINNSELSALSCELERRFNVENYLKYAALDVLMGNWDGYAYNKNNYYLAIDNRTGQFQFLPYDLDNTLGIDWLGQDWASRNALEWENDFESRPLYQRLMEVPEYAQRFEYYVRNYSQTIMHPDTISQIAEEFIQLIAPAADEDIYRTLDYGFTYDDFINSVDSAWGNQVAYGINRFVALRDSMTLEQTIEQSLELVIQGGYIEQSGTKAYCFVSEAGAENVSLNLYSDAQGSSILLSRPMLDDGVLPDLIAGDGIYSCEVSPDGPLEGDRFYYQFNLDNEGSLDAWPCSARLYLIFGPNDHYINEVMSRNTSSIQDNEGNYSDWIELHNPTNTVWNTADYFLTDNYEYLNKWPLPELSILPGNFRLFWANELEDLNRNNCNFSLAASGETLWLVKKEDDAYLVTQQIIIPALEANESYGPITDGGDNWIVFGPGANTPNASNQATGSPLLLSESFKIYPNPAKDILNFNRNINNVRVFNSVGIKVLEAKNVRKIELNNLSKGFYFLEADNFTEKFIIN